MTLEKALVTQAGPYMLAAKAQALIAAEVGKGCEGKILTSPVALEPSTKTPVAERAFAT